MSRMSDIHAAASEIDTTDADAVQALADALAAERYAADVAAYADAVRRVIEKLGGDGKPLECDECGVYDGARWDMPDGRAVCDGCMSVESCYACGANSGRYVSGGVEHCEECHAAQGDPA